jgi:4-alpha-glucanotransferase
LYIDLEGLFKDGLLVKSEISNLQASDSSRVHYDKARRFREPRLRTAFKRFISGTKNLEAPQFNQFLAKHEYWLEDFAFFCVFAKVFKTRNWRRWPSDIRKRKPAALNEAQAVLKEDLDFVKFLQFKFFTQWSQLKSYLKALDIGLVGDLPFFASYRSSDVWSRQKYFRLKSDGSPKFVAGVPPDYYCPEGQLWGNPLYNWSALQKDGFNWWIERIRHLTTLFEVVRLDHFIGYYRCWEINADANTAQDGRFRKTPGQKLFQAIKSVLGDLPFVAEDLGTVIPQIYDLRDEFEIPGMRVLQFGFGNEHSAKYHLPFSYTPNSVVYTGTHDNTTVVGWYDEAKKNKQLYDFRLYLDYVGADRKNVHWEMIRETMKSVANISILPMQDVLGLDRKARMNVPGTSAGNWQWGLKQKNLTKKLAGKLKKETRTFARLS